MSEYTIKQIGNGWLLTGPLDANIPAAGEETMFAPNLSMLYDILVVWQAKGFGPALTKYREMLEGK